MKKQLENNKFSFSKDSIVELNADQLNTTNSGSSNFCWAVTAYIIGEIIEGIDAATRH